MALTVNDILELPALKGFQLIAGNNGLDNDIITAGIADYEFAKGIDYDLNGAFEKDSLVISSLLFAKDDPSLLLPAIQHLKSAGVSAFAYKTVVFNSLPDEVISYAEENDFPIFSYSDNTWFENIIFDIMVAVERDDARHLSEPRIESMIRNTASQEEVDSIRKGISLLLNKTISVAYIKDPAIDNSRVFRAYYMSKHLRDKLLVAKYEDGVFVLITTSKFDTDAHHLILEDACQYLSLPVDASDLILSDLHPAKELQRAFQEAYYGRIAKMLSSREVKSYESLGIYAAILPLADTAELQIYAKNYMTKLEGYEDTITAYVNNGGDVVATSLDLHCHPNTIRYRLNKMKELVGAKNETDHELYRDLSICYAVTKAY